MSRSAERRPLVAVVDYEVTEQSPSGSCHLRLLEQLYDRIDFTVFANRFDNPEPSRIRFVPVRSLRRPAAARYVSFFAAASRLQRRRGPFDLVQTVEGYSDFCDISYVHFCHRAYLERAGRAHGLRAQVRRLDHCLRALGERRAVLRPRVLVVPSDGIRRDLVRHFDVPAERVHVVANPLVAPRWAMPPDFDQQTQRRALGAAPDDLVVAFVALGHFERKGLPILLAALGATPPDVRLVVIGGTPDLLRTYRKRALGLGVGDRVTWVGMQDDVRPHLWAADLLAMPSAYETYSLVLHQAAAAGVPLLATRMPGVTDAFEAAAAGVFVPATPPDLAAGLMQLRDMPASDRTAMGRRARAVAADVDVPSFGQRWRELYEELLGTNLDGTADDAVLTGRGQPMNPGVLTRLAELRSWSRHLGGASVGRLAAAHAVGLVAGKGLAMSGEPGLDEMLRAAGKFHDDAVSLLAEVGLALQSVDDPVDLGGLRKEFRVVSDDLTRRYSKARDTLAFGLPTRVQDETAFLLYAAVRTLRPAVVVETGVANGHSSFFLLAALDANDHGRLHSFDIDDACGVLVEQRDRWQLTICRSSDPAAEFTAALRSIGRIDVFFHDADHRYLSQLLEYRAVWPLLVLGGLLLSDDVDDSRAFFDFSRAVDRRPALLYDRTKVTGLVRR